MAGSYTRACCRPEKPIDPGKSCLNSSQHSGSCPLPPSSFRCLCWISQDSSELEIRYGLSDCCYGRYDEGLAERSSFARLSSSSKRVCLGSLLSSSLWWCSSSWSPWKYWLLSRLGSGCSGWEKFMPITVSIWTLVQRRSERMTCPSLGEWSLVWPTWRYWLSHWKACCFSLGV